jgi:hypothetical protein
MTNKKKIELYESILHRIQLLREVTMDATRLRELLDQIGNWSYSHRVGNGVLSERQQKNIINKNLKKMEDIIYGRTQT